MLTCNKPKLVFLIALCTVLCKNVYWEMHTFS